MIKLYDDLYAKYVLVSVLGGIIGMFVTLFLTTSTVISIFVLIFFVFFAAIHYGKEANKRVKEIYEHYDNCDIETYTNTFEEFYKKYNYKKLDAFIRIGLSTGYLAMGRYEEGLNILNDHEFTFKNNENGLTSKIIYLNNLIIAYAELDNYESANEKFLELKELMKNKYVSNENVIDKARELYFRNKMYLDLRQNPSKDTIKYAERFYLDRLEISKIKVNDVKIQNNLAFIYRKLKNKKKEEECLKFVVENGGTLYIVKEAKDRLKKLSD